MFLRSILFFCFFLRVVASQLQQQQYEPLFEEWIKEFRVIFQNAEHRNHVFVNWVENHIFIEKSNRLNRAFQLGHNQFSGMNQTEYVRWVRGGLGGVVNFFGSNPVVSDIAEYASLPASIDWTTKGAVTLVKDQGQCGSCWSFSTTGALEGAYAIKTSTLVSFSEQQLVDCDTLGNGGRDHGCNGGLMDNAFSWISKNNGLCTESDYPYVSGTTQTAGTCTKTCKNVAGSDVVKFVDVESASDLAFSTALSQQPVSVAIEADQREFQLYKSGVFTGACGTNLDHGVLAVGYGSENGVEYYKVKNSWSATWGEKGYIRLGKGASFNGGKGQCGILLEASYPVV
jgi:C1A family cysteine protease